MMTVALWALVIALGLQAGAGIFETRVLVPLWATNPPASVTGFFSQPLRPDSGRRLWIFLTPVTTLVCLANLVLALLTPAPWRAWWIFAAAAALAVMVATFAYFVPALLSFARLAEHPPADVPSRVRAWVMLNYLRAAVLVVAWVAALKAFALAV